VYKLKTSRFFICYFFKYSICPCRGTNHID